MKQCDWCRDPATHKITGLDLDSAALCGNCLTEAETEFVHLEAVPL